MSGLDGRVFLEPAALTNTLGGVAQCPTHTRWTTSTRPGIPMAFGMGDKAWDDKEGSVS